MKYYNKLFIFLLFLIISASYLGQFDVYSQDDLGYLDYGSPVWGDSKRIYSVVQESLEYIEKSNIEIEALKNELLRQEKKNFSLLKESNDLKSDNAKLKSRLNSLEKTFVGSESKIKDTENSLMKAFDGSEESLLKVSSIEKAIGIKDKKTPYNKKYIATLYTKLGNAYVQAKKYEKAIEVYEKVLNMNPSSARVHYNLGLIYEHFLSDTKKATFHLRKYLTLNPGAQDSEKVNYLIKIAEKKSPGF